MANRISSSHARRGLSASVIVFLLLLCAGRASAYTQLVVFGDSLSDSGNVFASSGGLIPIAPYFDGRFSNGPVWVETLASQLGLSATPSLSGGTNYAYGGARTGPAGDTPPSLVDQADTYLIDVANVADPGALYVVAGGGNDARDADTAATVANISDIITDLVTAGAASFLVANVPDLGKTPEAINDGNEAAASALAASVNLDLQLALADLRVDLGVTVLELDAFALLNDFVTNPGNYGFTNVDASCLVIVFPCSAPEQYLFWDTLHPTATAHALIGDAAYAAVVPLPATAWLLGSALGIAAWRRRRGETG